MRHRKTGRKLNRSTSHRQALFKSLLAGLLEHESIETTDAKAKEVRRLVEKLITLGKRGTVHARRTAARRIGRPDLLHKLFGDLADRFRQRPGGYTRIYKIGRRQGDGAPMSILQFLDPDEEYVPRTRVPHSEDGPMAVTTKETFDEETAESTSATVEEPTVDGAARESTEETANP